MVRFLDFYMGYSENPDKYTLGDMWELTDEQLENSHHIIQWLFPLNKPSAHSKVAPILTSTEVYEFKYGKDKDILQTNLLQSFDCYLEFMGLYRDSNQFKLRIEDSVRLEFILGKPNHNWLRITRILESLKLLGRKQEAIQFFCFLSHYYYKYDYIQLEFATSFKYWIGAIA